MRIIFVLLFAATCTACTSPIGIVRVDPDRPETRTGVAYPLLYTRFNVSVTRMVKACGAASITLATTVDASLGDAAKDPDQAYTIDPNSLAGVFRVSAVKAEYAKGGAIKSLNASAEDRTAPVLSAGAAGIVKLAMLPAAVAVAGTTAVPACSQSTLDALAELPKAISQVKQASNELTLTSTAYKAIQVRVTALGGIVDESTRRALVEARSRNDAAALSLAEKKTGLDKLKETLSHTDEFYWPRSGSEFHLLRAAPNNLLNSWKNPAFGQPLSMPQAVDLRLIGDVEHPDSFPAPGALKEAIKGLPYRMPRSGYLLACESDCTPANQLALVPAEVLQLGMHYYLPCQSQIFGSTGCTLTMDENGIPTSAGTETKVAAAENAALAFKDLATQYSTVREARRDAEKLAYEGETARLKAKAEYEKAVASPPPPTALQSLNDQTTFLKAYVDYYTAMKAYTEAKNAAVAP